MTRSAAAWLALGVVLLFGGFALLMGMTIRAIEPRLALSLLGFVAMVVGTMLAIVGTIAWWRGRG